MKLSVAASCPCHSQQAHHPNAAQHPPPSPRGINHDLSYAGHQAAVGKCFKTSGISVGTGSDIAVSRCFQGCLCVLVNQNKGIYWCPNCSAKQAECTDLSLGQCITPRTGTKSIDGCFVASESAELNVSLRGTETPEIEVETILIPSVPGGGQRQWPVTKKFLQRRQAPPLGLSRIASHEPSIS